MDGESSSGSFWTGVSLMDHHRALQTDHHIDVLIPAKDKHGHLKDCRGLAQAARYSFRLVPPTPAPKPIPFHRQPSASAKRTERTLAQRRVEMPPPAADPKKDSGPF